LFLLALQASFGCAAFDVAFGFFDFLVHDLVVGAFAGTLGA
jgi:hypothetical protein